MRVNDVAVPVVDPDDGDTRAGWWRGRLVIALERLPASAYVWDDTDESVCWDDPDPDRFVWDAPLIGSGFTDVFCDFVGLEIVHGDPDEAGIFPPSSARLQLRDPGDGRYRRRTPDGRLVYWALGRRLAVYWVDPAGEPWWRFSGRIATWRDEFDGSVLIEAFSGLAELAQEPGRHWSPGTAGQWPQQRQASILTAAGYTGPTWRPDLGDVTLALPDPERTPALELLQQCQYSDGGYVLSDADDTLRFADRRWRAGRTDQTRRTVFTDNVCGAGVVVWNPSRLDDDAEAAATVVLENVAGLIATAVAPSNEWRDPSNLFTHPDVDLWQTQVQGDALAAWILDVRSTGRMAIGAAEVMLHDTRFDYWSAMLDLRLGDLIDWTHEDRWPDGTLDVVNVSLIAKTIRDDVTPDSWIVTVATTTAVAYTPVELWGRTRFTYDDPDPLAVWR